MTPSSSVAAPVFPDLAVSADPRHRRPGNVIVSALMLVLIVVGTVGFTPLAVRAEPAEATANLNLRLGPSTGAPVIDVIPEGDIVEIIGDPENEFVSVSWSGKNGFAATAFLTIGKDTRPGSQVFALAENTDASASEGSSVAESAPASGPTSGPTDIVSIIYAAAATYGQSGDDMVRVATCESGLNPGAVNASSGASGLFQFMPGTWTTTPYGDQNIFDPVANANAAGWMWANGRRGEWECQ